MPMQGTLRTDISPTEELVEDDVSEASSDVNSLIGPNLTRSNLAEMNWERLLIEYREMGYLRARRTGAISISQVEALGVAASQKYRDPAYGVYNLPNHVVMAELNHPDLIQVRLKMIELVDGKPLTKELEELATKALAGTVVEEVASEEQEAVITEAAFDDV